VDDVFIGVGVNHGRGDGLVPQHLLEDGGWHSGLGRIPAKGVPPGGGLNFLLCREALSGVRWKTW
jgi:hypothetical protein